MNSNALLCLLAVTLTTNEVTIGTATIHGKEYAVVGLQVVTNKTLRAVATCNATASRLDYGVTSESWTNTHAGPFVGTNFVARPYNPWKNWPGVSRLDITNFVTTNVWVLSATNSFVGPDLFITR